MTTERHRIIDTRTAYAGWAKIVVAKIRAPGGETMTREIEDHGAAVCVLPYHPARRTAVLVKQFRAPVFFAFGQEETIEAIAGILEETEPEECARRETDEEAGMELDTMERVLSGLSMPGLSTERMHFFFATYSGTPRAEISDENIQAIEIGLPQLAGMVDREEITDIKTLLLVQTMRLRKPELFV